MEHSLVGSRWRRPTAGWQRWRPRSPRRTMVRAAGCGTKLVLERLKDAGLFREAREGFEQWSAIHGHLPPARTEPPAERPRLVERGGRDQSAVEPTETMNAINGTPSTFDDWSRSWASCCTKRAKRSPRTTSPGSCRPRALKSFIDNSPNPMGDRSTTSPSEAISDVLLTRSKGDGGDRQPRRTRRWSSHQSHHGRGQRDAASRLEKAKRVVGATTETVRPAGLASHAQDSATDQALGGHREGRGGIQKLRSQVETVGEG